MARKCAGMVLCKCGHTKEQHACEDTYSVTYCRHCNCNDWNPETEVVLIKTNRRLMDRLAAAEKVCEVAERVAGCLCGREDFTQKGNHKLLAQALKKWKATRG